MKIKNGLVLFFILTLPIVITGCSDCEDLGNESIDRNFKNESAFKSAKQENPQNINLYVDISASIQNYLDPSAGTSGGKLYENFIRSLFGAKQNATINLWGFGDSLIYLGDQNNAVASLLDRKTYSKSSSRINLAFDKIAADTTNSLNVVLSDAIYEENKGVGNAFGFLIGPYFKKELDKNNMFALIAGRYSYYSTVLKKVFQTPLYLFVFGNQSYHSYVNNNLVPLGENAFVLSPNYDTRASINISPNADIIISSDNYKGVEVNDYSMPVQFDVKLERGLPNGKMLENAENEKYKMNVYFTNFRCLNDMQTMDEWREVTDLKTDLATRYSQDSSRQILNFKFSRSFPQAEFASVYKFVISKELPSWILEKYSSGTPEEMEKTYRFQDFFTTLQNHLKEKPVPLFTYYIIVK
ncbi:MAG: hypothetical protein EHM58_09845 [Ignavibacteriae bacterium]|nr:MAG: hypothetical protein EHM58_09845 [Ignavibacteriota bacterium]